MADSQDSTRMELQLKWRWVGLDLATCNGSLVQLIEAGILTPDDPLPGERGQHKTYVSFPDDDPRGLICVWPRRRGRFTVMMHDYASLIPGAVHRGGEITPTEKPAKRTPLRLVWSDGRPV